MRCQSFRKTIAPIPTPIIFFPFQVTVRRALDGKYGKHNSWVEKRRAKREAKEMANYGHANGWDRVFVHDTRNGELVATYEGKTYGEKPNVRLPNEGIVRATFWQMIDKAIDETNAQTEKGWLA